MNFPKHERRRVFFETLILAKFRPKIGHETTIFLKIFNNFPKKKKNFVETSSGFKKIGQMKEVVSKKLLKIRNTMDYHDFESPHRVFQKADFPLQIENLTLFLKPRSKLKSHLFLQF